MLFKTELCTLKERDSLGHACSKVIRHSPRCQGRTASQGSSWLVHGVGQEKHSSRGNSRCQDPEELGSMACPRTEDSAPAAELDCKGLVLHPAHLASLPAVLLVAVPTTDSGRAPSSLVTSPQLPAVLGTGSAARMSGEHRRGQTLSRAQK